MRYKSDCETIAERRGEVQGIVSSSRYIVQWRIVIEKKASQSKIGEMKSRDNSACKERYTQWKMKTACKGA